MGCGRPTNSEFQQKALSVCDSLAPEDGDMRAALLEKVPSTEVFAQQILHSCRTPFEFVKIGLVFWEV